MSLESVDSAGDHATKIVTWQFDNVPPTPTVSSGMVSTGGYYVTGPNQDYWTLSGLECARIGPYEWDALPIYDIYDDVVLRGLLRFSL